MQPPMAQNLRGGLGLKSRAENIRSEDLGVQVRA